MPLSDNPDPRLKEASSADRERRARAVRESLAAYATPALTERLVRLALLRAGETGVPAGGARFREFARHLRRIVESELGTEEADMVERGVEAILARAPAAEEDDDISHVEPIARARYERAAARHGVPEADPPASAEPRGAPEGGAPQRTPSLVVAASGDSSRIVRVQRLLRADVSFRGAGDAMALLDVLEPRSAPVVVVDCQVPAIRPATLAALVPELPPDTHVVLWGLDPEEADQLHALAEGARAWRRCPSESTDRELATVICELLG